MAGTMQELRRERGYRSAREFAEALGISSSSMSRYDAQPELIPTKVAWAMADLLGCSIDEVVGREPVAERADPGEAQAFHDSLSPEGRELYDELQGFAREFVAQRERKAELRAQAAERRRYERLADFYERLFLQGFLDGAQPDDVEALEWPGSVRDGVEALAAERMDEARTKAARGRARGLVESLRRTGQFDDAVRELGMSPDDPGAAEALEDYHANLLLDREDAHPEHAREVMAKIMAAYDRLHPDEAPGRQA